MQPTNSSTHPSEPNTAQTPDTPGINENDFSPLQLEQGSHGFTAVPQVAIDWYRTLPWWRLLSQTAVISWRASHILVATLAFFITSLGWNISGLLFHPENKVVSAPVGSLYESSLLSNNDSLTVLAMPVESPVPFVWSQYFVAPLQDLSRNLSLRSVSYIFFGMLWTICVWSFAGGMLARRSIMEMGVRSSVGWTPTIKLVTKRWHSMVWSITLPLVALGLFSLIPLGLGVVARLGTIGQTLALIAMVPATLLVLTFGWTVTIVALSFSLSICAIVSEKGADALDGLARASAYVLQRPMTALCVLLLSGGLGWISSLIFMMVLSTGKDVLWAAFSIGFGGDIAASVPLEATVRKSMISYSDGLVRGLGIGFLFSFFWTASAAAYLTLRWEIDHTDFDDLDLQELGEPVAVPKIQRDTRGVAEVVDTNESTDVG